MQQTAPHAALGANLTSARDRRVDWSAELGSFASIIQPVGQRVVPSELVNETFPTGHHTPQKSQHAVPELEAASEARPLGN